MAKETIQWERMLPAEFHAAVDALLKGWRKAPPWAAWQHIPERRLVHYGAYLVEERFDEIEKVAAKLL